MGRGIMPTGNPLDMADWLDGVEEGVTVGPDVLGTVSAMLRTVEEMRLNTPPRVDSVKHSRPDYEIVAEIAARLSDGHIPERDRQEAITRGCDWYWVSRARAILAESRRQCAGEVQVEGGAS